LSVLITSSEFTVDARVSGHEHRDADHYYHRLLGKPPHLYPAAPEAFIHTRTAPPLLGLGAGIVVRMLR
jgi:hypothetical protein